MIYSDALKIAKGWKLPILAIAIAVLGLLLWLNRPSFVGTREFLEQYRNAFNLVVDRQQSLNQLLYEATPEVGGLDSQEIRELQVDLLRTETEIRHMRAQVGKEKAIRQYLLVSLGHLRRATSHLNGYLETRDNTDYSKAQEEEHASQLALSKAQELAHGIKIPKNETNQ